MNRQITINPFQYFMIQTIFFGGMSFFLYPDFILHSTNHAFWIPTILWAAPALFGAWLYARTMMLFPGHSIVEIGIRCLGRIGAFLMLFPLLLFWFNSIAIMVRSHAEMITMTMLPTTPPWFLSGLLVIPLFAAAGGIQTIIRSAGVFFIVAFPLSMLMNAMSMENIDFTLGKPWVKMSGDFLNNPYFYASSYVWVGFIYSSVIGKFVSDIKGLWKLYGVAAVCFLPLILAGVLLPILTFGPELSRQLTFPYVTKMDSIDSYWIIFENLTAVFVSTTMIYVVSTISLMYFCLAEGIQVFFPSWNKKIIFMMLGLLTYVAAISIPSWQWMVQAVVWETPLRLFLAFVLPLIILAIEAWRRKGGRDEQVGKMEN